LPRALGRWVLRSSALQRGSSARQQRVGAAAAEKGASKVAAVAGINSLEGSWQVD
jgi:hypothetical protein